MNDQICKNCNLSIHPIPYCHCNNEVTAFNYKDLLDKTIKSKLEAVEVDLKELGDLWKLDKSVSEQGGGYPIKVTDEVLEIINKHK